MDELSIRKEEAIALTEGGGLADAIKPLTREIYLFDTFVAGVSHLKDKSVLEEIKTGDQLLLRREDNKFDDKAILLLTKSGKKLGYVPEKDNAVFSRLMDAGKMLTAYIRMIKVCSIDYHQISIAIYLVDF